MRDQVEPAKEAGPPAVIDRVSAREAIQGAYQVVWQGQVFLAHQGGWLREFRLRPILNGEI